MKAFIFDMDGLMFDTERVYVEAWDHVGERMGYGKAGYMCLKTLGMNNAACEQAWRDEFGDDVDLEALWRYSREFMQDYYSKYTVSVKKGLHDLLTYLKRKGYKLAVASSTRRDEVERLLTSAYVRQYFDVVIGGDMVAQSKPEPDIYLKAAACMYSRHCRAMSQLRTSSRLPKGPMTKLSTSSSGCHRSGTIITLQPALWAESSPLRLSSSA